MDDATVLALAGRFFDLVQLIALAYIAMMQQRAHGYRQDPPDAQRDDGKP